MDALREELKAKIDDLPPRLLQEVEDFVDFLREKRRSEIDEGRQGNVRGRGALSELKEDYTSVDLQHKILEWWQEDTMDY